MQLVQRLQFNPFMKKHIISLALILVTSTSAMAQSVDWFVGTDTRITCNEEGEADRIVNVMLEEGGGSDQFRESLTKSGVKLRTKLMDLLTKKEVSGATFDVEMDEYVKKAVCLSTVVVKGNIAAGFDLRFKKTLTMVETQLEKNKKEMPSSEEAVTPAEQSNAYANDILFANRGAVSFVMTMFENR